MPTFEITTPTGTFEVDAPDESTALDALRQAGEMPEQQQPSGGVMSDMAQSLGAGVRSGVESLAGFAGDLNEYGGRGASFIAGKLGASPETAENIGNVVSRASPLTFGMPTTERVQQESNAAFGDALKHDPQTTAGEYAKTVGEFLPAAVAGPGGIARRVATQAVLPGLGSEAMGQATEGTAFEPYARAGGAIAAGLGPSVVSRVISPVRTSPDRAKMAQSLADEGIDLTAGQKTGSERLRYMESELGGMAGQRLMEKQGEQFTSAALKRAGIAAERATPEVMDDAFSRIGQQFDDLASRNNIVADQKLGTDLKKALNEYGSLVPKVNRAPAVEGITREIVQSVKNNGGVAGPAYQALRSRLERMARSAAADPQLSRALRDIRSALDDAMERSMAKTNPGDIKAWRQARKEYRNLLVLEKASTGAGENAAAGLISPSQLRNATVQQGRRSYARGQGDFAELARAGEGVMKPLPQSGTAPRTAARNLGASFASLLGGGVGGAMGGGAGAIGGMIAGAAIPPAIGRLMLTKAGRTYLSNQVAAGLKGADPKTLAVIATILAGQRGQPALPPPSK